MRTSVIFSASRSNLVSTLVLLVFSFQLHAQTNEADRTVSSNPQAVSDSMATGQAELVHPAQGNAGSRLQMNAFMLINSQRVKMAFDNPDHDQVYVELRDQKGSVLFSEYSRKDFYLRSFNFASALPGTYTLTARGAGQICTRQIRITNPQPPRRIEFDQPKPLIARER